MADDINQQFSIDASGALKALDALNSAYAKQEQAIQSLAATMAKFNGSSNGVANASATGARSLNTYAQSSKTLRSTFDDLISAHGRWTTSVSLASRIIFTQAVVIGFRQARVAIEEAMQASIAFQKQLSELKSIDSDKILPSDIGDKLRGVSTQFNIPLPQVAAGAYEALSSQVLKTAGDLRFMETAAQFSKGALTSMDSTVKGLAGGLNAYGQGVEGADRLASQFNETIRLGTIRGEELAQGFGTVATLGHQLGVSQAELLASVAALTNAGVPQAQAFTQVRGVLTGLVKPSEDLTKVFRANGIASAEQLIAARGLGGALQFLREQTDGTTAGTAELFRNQRALLGVLSIGGQNAKFYAEALKTIDGVSSSLNAERAQQVMASDAEQLTAKWNTLKNSLIPLGDGLVSISNKGIDTLAVFRDFSVAVLDSAGSLARAQPRVTEFGNAWQSLQALFGKDLTIGESGGKIVSEIEIRTRQLDVIARKHAEDDKKRAAAEAIQSEALNKIRFRELDNFADRNRDLQTEAQSSADRIIAIKRQEITELTRLIAQSRALIKDSPGRIEGIQARQDRRNFDTRTEGLAPEQQSLALIQRAQDQERQANAAMARARQTGAKEDIDRARALYEAAQSTGEEAQNLSKSNGDRRGALFAARQLSEFSDRQVAAERGLAASAQARIPTLEQERTKRQASLDLIEKATKELIKNSTLFDKQGNQLPADQLAKQAEARKRALNTLAEQGVSKDEITRLSFQTDGSLQQLAGELKSALSNIDASPFQTAQSAIEASVGPANAMASAYERAARAAAQLGNGPAPAGSPDGYASGGLVPQYLASGGSAFESFVARGSDTVPAMLTPGEFVTNKRATDRWLPQLKAMNAGFDPKPASPRIDNSQHGIIGDVNINIPGAAGPQATAREVIQAIRREQRRGSGNSLR